MQVTLLARHFFWRFFDNDLVSPESDAHQAASLTVAFVATPGIFVCALLFLKYGNPWLSAPRRLEMALYDKLQFISWSMMVMALTTVVVWDALDLDARDHAILGPLPIRRRTLLSGKLLAMTSFVAVFALAANAVAIVLFPLAFLSSSQLPFTVGFWVMVGHASACLGAAVFAFLSVLAARGLLLNILGARLFRRVSLPAQFVLALTVVTASSSLSVSALAQGGARLYLFPQLWFLGLYETVTGRGILITMPRTWAGLYGVMDVQRVTPGPTYVEYWPLFERLAVWGVAGIALCAVAAAAMYVAGYWQPSARRGDAAKIPTAGRRPFRRGLAWAARRLIVRDPIAQASFFFTLQTLGRSARHRLYLAAYFLVGCVLTYTAIMSLAGTRGARASAGPTADALAIQLVLSFFLVVGIRVAFTFPAELRSNWTFRLTAGGEIDVRRYLAGVRRAIVFCFVLPFFAALLPAQAILWGPRVALLHFAAGSLWAAILLEVLLLGFRKLPFASSHVPGSANVKVFGAAYFVGFLAYAYGFASLERAALDSGAGTAILLGALTFALTSLAIYRARLLSRRRGFVFDEFADPAVVTLGL